MTDKRKTKKVPISLNHIEQGELQELADMLGLGDINKDYGTIPQTIKASINLTKALILKIEKGIPDLNPAELELFFTSIRQIKEQRYKEKIIEKAKKEAKEYTLQTPKK